MQFENQKLKIFVFQCLVLLGFLPSILGQILFMNPGFVSRWTLHESYMPTRIDDSGFLNHAIRKPEAQDIRVSMSSLALFLTEHIGAYFVYESRFCLALDPL